MTNAIFEIIVLIVMMLIVTYSWRKNDKSAWKSILFTVFSCGVFYFNLPNFMSILDGVQIKYGFFSLPFSLYDQFGPIYIIFTNFLLGCIGVYLGKDKSESFSAKEIKKRFDRFIVDATELKVIGRDLDFLLDEDNEEYRTQREKIKSLGNHAKLLCAWTNDIKLIKLYHNLIKEKNQIRAYTNREGIANLKGQIKKDEHNTTSGLFVLKASDSPDRFEISNTKNGYLLDAVDQQFDKTFSNSLHPVIRCIALDLGGVYFDGDIDMFYQYLRDKYSLTIRKKVKDRLNIDNNLMLGKITIQEFITQRATPKNTVDKLSQDDWNDITNQWQDTWHPNQQIRSVINKLSQLGYTVVPFSNLDKQNGDKYLREHDLPDCCTTHYFSYEHGKTKPTRDAFSDFTKFVKGQNYIQEPYQILLIDDETDNLMAATEQGWEHLQFYNDSSSNAVNLLVQKLKEQNILPDDYKI